MAQDRSTQIISRMKWIRTTFVNEELFCTHVGARVGVRGWAPRIIDCKESAASILSHTV